MTSQPLVSIITPSFNQARFLEKTITSVLRQDYPNLEYLIADGGSRDESAEIIRKFEDKLAWWVSEKDGGQAEAINKGLSRAKGEYLAWINSDDYYLPGAVSEAVRVLDENPSIGLVYGNVQVVDENEMVLNNLEYGDWELRDLMSFKIIGQPAVFMRRKSLEAVGPLDTSFHLLLDHHLWLRLGLVAGMKHQAGFWARAHYHEGCKNLALAAEFGREAFRIVEWMKTEPSFSHYFGVDRKKIYAGAERLNAFYLLDAKMYRESFKAYWRSFRMRPGTVLPEWYRMVFALLAPLGFEPLLKMYRDHRTRKANRNLIQQ